MRYLFYLFLLLALAGCAGSPTASPTPAPFTPTASPTVSAADQPLDIQATGAVPMTPVSGGAGGYPAPESQASSPSPTSASAPTLAVTPGYPAPGQEIPTPTLNSPAETPGYPAPPTPSGGETDFPTATLEPGAPTLTPGGPTMTAGTRPPRPSSTPDEPEDILPPPGSPSPNPNPTGGADAAQSLQEATPTLTATPTASATASPTPTRARATSTPGPGWCPVSIGPEIFIPTATPTSGPPTAMPASPLPVQIHFLKEGRLWQWQEGDQEPIALTGTGGIERFLLSPDGSSAALLLRSGDGFLELWVSDLNGTETLLAGARALGEGVEPDQWAWIPGRRSLLFSTLSVSGDGTRAPQADLWRADTATGRVSQILSQGEAGAFAVSPDGRQVAVGSADRLTLIDNAGGSRRENILPGYAAVQMGPVPFYPLISWTADSQALRVALPAPVDANDPSPRVDLWEVPMPGFEERKLATVPGGDPASFAFSPDGLYAAYSRVADPRTGARELHIVTLSGIARPDFTYRSGPRLEFISWAPGGAGWAFLDGRTGTLYYQTLCGPAVRLSEYRAPLGRLEWLDPQRFLFLSGAPGSWVLRLGQVGQPTRPLLTLGDATLFSALQQK